MLRPCQRRVALGPVERKESRLLVGGEHQHRGGVLVGAGGFALRVREASRARAGAAAGRGAAGRQRYCKLAEPEGEIERRGRAAGRCVRHARHGVRPVHHPVTRQGAAGGVGIA